MAGINSTATTPEELANPYPFDGMTDDEINAIPLDEFCDKLLAHFDAKRPILNFEQMDIIEETWERYMVSRRCALITLTKPFSEIRKMVEEDRRFALAVAEIYNNTADNGYYATVHNLMENAHKWAEMALLGREDMKQLIEEVKERVEEVAHA